MRILIVGEFSAFSKYLSLGFNMLGHDSFVLSWGDSFKKIKQGKESLTVDISNYTLFGCTIKGSHYLRRFISYFKLKSMIHTYHNSFDYVIVINPCFIRKKHNLIAPYPTLDEVKSMLKDKSNIFLSACGNDYIFNSYLPYRKKISDWYRCYFYKQTQAQASLFKFLIKDIKGVIPVMVDYASAYRYFQDKYSYKIYPTIPLPFLLQPIGFKHKNNKVKILHGITRSKEKGSDIIVEALTLIQEKYAQNVEIQIVEKVSFEKYLTILNETDILIDQCFSYSYGMNAIEAMSLGKVVLSGNEPENIKEFNVENCPVINIEPNKEDIYKKLKYLIDNPKEIIRISKESVNYAHKLHDCRLVAERYISLFNSIDK